MKMKSLLSAIFLLGATWAQAESLSTEKMVDLLKGIDMRIRASGDYKALVYLEQKATDKPDVAQEAIVYRRDVDEKFRPVNHRGPVRLCFAIGNKLIQPLRVAKLLLQQQPEIFRREPAEKPVQSFFKNRF